MASKASFPIPLFSRESFVKNLFPVRPLFARSVAPVSLNLLLDSPRAVNFCLFLMMLAMLLEPSGVILFAYRYSSLNSVFAKRDFSSSSRYSWLTLQLLRARDFRSFLLARDLIIARPPSPPAYRSLCVKKKSVNLVFSFSPSARIYIA